MKKINLDKEWTFRRCFLDTIGMLEIPGEEVNLPHDGMIGTEVSKDAPAGIDSGFFNGNVSSYTKYVFIPKEWEGDKVGLYFDGVMMHSTIDINGCKAGEHHYGYTPFFVDISDLVSWGEENRITININTGVQPSSRWYTGSGLFRSVSLCHSPRVYVKTDGIYAYTKEVSDETAYIEALIDLRNDTLENRLVKVVLELIEENGTVKAVTSGTVMVNACGDETVKLSFSVEKPALWDVDTPNLYKIKVSAVDTGVYRTHFIKNETETVDEDFAVFGIRTITADAKRGLRINGKTVKLKGGCLHHDNGLLGSVSLYESEERKIKKLKEIGFNAVRTAHNPPSASLVEACDRVGMYIFDEAFDAWGMAKRPGDFNMYFENCWEREISAFVKRDRVHPSVIMWSTGNEIPERGGLNNGYSLASQLAGKVKSLDASRPVSNGICSFWSGLDDKLAMNQNLTQNAKNDENSVTWEAMTEPFTNGLDVVGYNYMEDQYEKDHEMFPERVILGSENFPKEIGFRWPVVEKLPYVIGDFTWTAWDYIGEAGIGKSLFVNPDDPLVEKGPWAIMPQATSPYPWRLANDADYDINGNLLPQGAYRSVVWGSDKTYLYSYNPDNFDKVEVIGMWGFTDVSKNWNYDKYIGKPVRLIAFSNADEVELTVNGKTVERKPVNKERPLPNSVCFDTVFESGRVEAVSYKDGLKVSSDVIETTGLPAELNLISEKESLKADGHDVTYISVEVADSKQNIVPDAIINLEITSEGPGIISGFGSSNPVTEENYTDSFASTYKGRATAVIRSGYECGEMKVTVTAKELGLSRSLTINIV